MNQNSPSGNDSPQAAAPTPEAAAPGAENSRIADMFGRIVKVYDPMNRVLSLGQDQHWRDCLARTALLGLRNTPLPTLLDIAAGTLDVSLKLAAARPDARVLALDFCLPMLRQGLGKLPPQSRIVPVAGDARRLPLPESTVDALTMAFGIRNVNPRAEAFAEMVRVLKPGGRACVLEFSPPEKTGMRQIYGIYLQRFLPWIGGLISRDNAYGYLAHSINTFPSPGELAKEMRAAGFSRVYHMPLTLGIVRLHVAEK